MDWISFGNRRPEIGQRIEIKFDNGEVLDDYGTVKSIVNHKDLPVGSVVWMGDSIRGDYWSLCSDRYVNSMVRDTYFWRMR
jgi:hypothetical protein